MNSVFKFVVLSISLVICGCFGRPMLWSPPPWDFESWKKEGVNKDGVKRQLLNCGAKNVYTRAPSETEGDIARQEICMFKNDFQYIDGYRGICSTQASRRIRECDMATH